VTNPNKTNITSRRRVIQHVRGGKGWLRQKNIKKNVRNSRRKIRIHREIKECEAAATREADRERRGRELAGLRKLGRML
jgi:hypothetical protein